VQTAVGTARASNGADLAPGISGVVESVHFMSGLTVAAGTMLLQLRPNDDDAKLQQLQAIAELASVTLHRDLEQLAVHGVAQATVDSDAANLKFAQAQVAAQRAIIAEKTIRAPFAGKLGVRQVDIGQFISAGTTIVTLQQLDPMYVEFYLPQQSVGRIAVDQTVEVTVDAYPDKLFLGRVSSIDAKVNQTSRMLKVQATVANPDGVLLPGMFLSVSVAVGEVQRLVTIPQAAIAYNPYGALVYIVRQSNDDEGHVLYTAEQRFVTTGAARGDRVSSLRGLDPNDVVVTAGQLKLHNNAVVKINNAVQPTDDQAPMPSDQ
jgi:membrane fusion protein (multidrug efflux system)